jgi:hypothetical protein
MVVLLAFARFVCAVWGRLSPLFYLPLLYALLLRRLPTIGTSVLSVLVR